VRDVQFVHGYGIESCRRCVGGLRGASNRGAQSDGGADAVADGEFVYLTRRGKRVAALMPADIAEHYEQIEDDYWARRGIEAQERMREHPEAAVPWAQVIAELERADE